tara:strand:- start:63 stop:440 length:378 start_codon:yes stop_codon:yes gene_type:complete
VSFLKLLLSTHNYQSNITSIHSQDNYSHFVDLFYKLLKRKENKLKYQRRDEPLKPLVVRLPVDLKEQLDVASKHQGISQSRLAVDLISQGLNQSVSLEAMLDDIEKEPPVTDDGQVDLEDWLSRI